MDSHLGCHDISFGVALIGVFAVLTCWSRGELLLMAGVALAHRWQGLRFTLWHLRVGFLCCGRKWKWVSRNERDQSCFLKGKLARGGRPLDLRASKCPQSLVQAREGAAGRGREGGQNSSRKCVIWQFWEVSPDPHAGLYRELRNPGCAPSPLPTPLLTSLLPKAPGEPRGHGLHE